MPAQAGDVIPGHHPAGIKAGTGETLGEADGESASHAGQEQCQRATRDQEPDPWEGSTMVERSLDDVGEQLGPPASNL